MFRTINCLPRSRGKYLTKSNGSFQWYIILGIVLSLRRQDCGQEPNSNCGFAMPLEQINHLRLREERIHKTDYFNSALIPNGTIDPELINARTPGLGPCSSKHITGRIRRLCMRNVFRPTHSSAVVSSKISLSLGLALGVGT